MGSDDKANTDGFGIETALTRLGRTPSAYYGFVNTPVFRGSTVLFPDAESLESRQVEYSYGRPSNPTTRSLETALAKLEGGARSFSHALRAQRHFDHATDVRGSWRPHADCR